MDEISAYIRVNDGKRTNFFSNDLSLFIGIVEEYIHKMYNYLHIYIPYILYTEVYLNIIIPRKTREGIWISNGTIYRKQ